MPYKRRTTGVQDSGASNRKYRKSDKEHDSNTSSSRNTEGNNNYYVTILINVNARWIFYLVAKGSRGARSARGQEARKSTALGDKL